MNCLIRSWPGLARLRLDPHDAPVRPQMHSGASRYTMCFASAAASGQAQYSTPFVWKNRPQRLDTCSASVLENMKALGCMLKAFRNTNSGFTNSSTDSTRVCPENDGHVTVLRPSPGNVLSRYSAT